MDSSVLKQFESQKIPIQHPSKIKLSALFWDEVPKVGKITQERREKLIKEIYEEEESDFFGFFSSQANSRKNTFTKGERPNLKLNPQFQRPTGEG